ncbi:MAG: hypothetical protein ACPKPY_14385 [Nitrososphaeraceae archaeon]
MTEFSELKGQELMDINEKSDNELELIFKNNKYILSINEGKFIIQDIQ